jgi:hypothetical protein
VTAERMALVVGRWVRLYTRDLPAPVARRRVEEIEADVHDHVAHERARGTADHRIARGLAGRMVRGLPADAAWRRAQRPSREGRMTAAASRSVRRVALVTALVLLVPLVANQFTEGEGWSPGDFVLAAVLLLGSGTLLELAARRPAGVVPRALAVAIGAAAAVLGEADDAPGLMLFGFVLVGGTIALSVRTALRSRSG